MRTSSASPPASLLDYDVKQLPADVQIWMVANLQRVSVRHDVDLVRLPASQPCRL